MKENCITWLWLHLWNPVDGGDIKLICVHHLTPPPRHPILPISKASPPLSLCEISPRALIYSPQLIHKEPITTISTISKPIKTISNSNLNCAKVSPSERNDSCFCFFTKQGPDKKNISVLKAGRGWSENIYSFTFHLKPFYVLCASPRLFFRSARTS